MCSIPIVRWRCNSSNNILDKQFYIDYNTYYDKSILIHKLSILFKSKRNFVEFNRQFETHAV